MKKLIGVVLLSLLLTGCGDGTIKRSYSCEGGGHTFMAEFHKDGTVLLGTNGSAMEYKYEKVDKDVYRIIKFGKPIGDVVATKKGFIAVEVGQGLSFDKNAVLPCVVK